MESEPRTTKVYWSLILIFLYFSAGIALAGYAFFWNQRSREKQGSWRQLDSILTLKTYQIASWRKERKIDGEVIFADPFIAPHVEQFLKHPGEAKSKTDMLHWMQSLQRLEQNQSYKRVLLLRPNMEIALSFPQDQTSLDTSSKQFATQAAEDKKVIFSDLYRDDTSNSVRAGLFVPVLMQRQGDSVTMAVVFLEIDPKQFLYPLLQTWPVPSKTAETLLVRREGEEVLFLNELRYKKGTALTLRMPISDSQVLAAKVTRGEEGIIEGLDYRGEQVIGAIGKIPDSSWFLVAKVDQREVYAPIRADAMLVSAVVSALVLVVAAILGFLWRGQHIQEHRLWAKDMKELQGHLERRAAELESSNIELETLSYSLSHDLRNPLIAMKGLSKTILQRHSSRLDKEVIKIISVMDKQSRKMLQLVDDLTRFFRFRHQEVNFAPVDMTEIERTVVDELNAEMPEEGLKVYAKPLPPSCGDAAMIRQALYNLLSNAIKFTRPKEDRIIEINCKPEEKEDIFYVKDNGIGFDMKDAPRLCEAFSRLHPAEFEGTGIGLAIAKAIIDKHGGRLWAEGAPNQGATFYFSLPRRENCGRQPQS